MSNDSLKWWQKTVVYQIYPRSFRDSSGDGIGDIKGIIEKLDYLDNLGIETIWFSPFFESPQQDFGYDISNFRQIDPTYGSMKDFDRLLDEIHNRNMKIVVDLVLNHTSVKHPWFIESASSKDNTKRDWYIWRDGKKPRGKKPPNNWKSLLGDPAWRYYENTGQWVYFHFLPFQPDLNYRNIEVKEEMFNTIRFWLDKGVDGFRLDILHSIYEDENLRDNPITWRLYSEKKVAYNFQYHKYDLNLPEIFDLTIELRSLMDEYEPERFLVGEVFGSIEELKKYYGLNNDGLHMVFLFEFTTVALKFKPQKVIKLISRVESTLPFPYTPTYVYGNHDRSRYLSLLNNNSQKAKLLATMQLTLRGVPFIYYGEEIGMVNGKIKLKKSKDPIGRKFAKFPLAQIAKLLGIFLSRDVCRTPMQWGIEPNAGFSVNENVKPWLKISEKYKNINVKKEENDPESLLNCYKRLLKLRNKNITLQNGEFEFIEQEKLNKKCIAYCRIYNGEKLSVYLNFSAKKLLLKKPKKDSILLFSTISSNISNRRDIEGTIKLSPYEGIIFK